VGRTWLAVLVMVGARETARPVDPEAVCPSDPRRPENLGCGVFRALAAENEAAYVVLVMTARADGGEAADDDHPR
jgi:hypothetical protein